MSHLSVKFRLEGWSGHAEDVGRLRRWGNYRESSKLLGESFIPYVTVGLLKLTLSWWPHFRTPFSSKPHYGLETTEV